MAFRPPQGNQTVMVDNSNNIVYPASFNRISVNQAIIAGNNFTSVPSVINPENATTTQLPSVASVVNYVADVVEGGSSGLIPVIQKDIQILGQEKANIGEFYFKDNGRLSTGSPIQINGAFTCIWTTTRGANVYGGSTSAQRKGWVYTSLYQTSGKGFCLAMDDTYMGFYFRYLNSNGEVVQISITKTQIQYYDGKPHTYAFIFDGANNVQLLIDNVQAFTGVVTDFVPFTTSHPLSITSPNQTCSRIKWFNFDMSDANAPYTIADYISGKDVSPLLLKGTQKVLDSNYPYWVVNNNTDFDLTIDSNADTLIATCKSSNTYLTISDYGRSGLKAGDVVTVSWSSIITPAGISVYGTDIFVTGNVGYHVVNGGTFVNAVDSSYMMFRVSFNTRVEVGDTITIKGLRIRVNGALLSLDDYSIKVGATQIVPDVSGNNNDATITGVVIGSKDTSIAKMAQLFYQSQQG